MRPSPRRLLLYWPQEACDLGRPCCLVSGGVPSGALRPPTWARRSGGTGGHSAGAGSPPGLLHLVSSGGGFVSPTRVAMELVPELVEEVAAVFVVVGEARL